MITAQDKDNNNNQAEIIKEGNYGQSLQGTVCSSCLNSSHVFSGQQIILTSK